MKYIVILVVFLILYIFVEVNAPKPINWKPSYSIQEKSPLGLYIFNDLLHDLFKDRKIIQVFDSPYSFVRKKYTGLKGIFEKKIFNYIIISNKVETDEYDIKNLKKFVMKGNYCFISAQSFSKISQKKLKFSSTIRFTNTRKYKKSFYTLHYKGIKKVYSYKSSYANFYFKTVPKNTHVIVRDEKKKPVAIMFSHGTGYFILSTMPEIFTNNALLYSQKSRLAYDLISLLPVRDVYMDEYFTAYAKGSSTPLRVILRDKSLSKVYYIFILMLILFIIFKARRRQRIIPVITAPENESLKFIEMVGKLYYQKKDNMDLAFKKITYFREFIKSTYSISINKISLEALSAKINADIDDLRRLFDLIKSIENSSDISDKDLTLLNNLIYNIITVHQ